MRFTVNPAICTGHIDELRQMGLRVHPLLQGRAGDRRGDAPVRSPHGRKDRKPMSNVVERARTLLEGVYGEPWVNVGGGNIHVEPVGTRPPVAKAWNRATAEFIAAARSLVPELIAELERKSAQLAEWRAQYDAIDTELERLRQQRTIGTVAELDALPFLAIIREIFKPSPGKGLDYGGVYERRTSGWHCIAGAYTADGPHNGPPRLPCRLLWLPEWGDA